MSQVEKLGDYILDSEIEFVQIDNVTIQPYINVVGRLNNPQIDNCTQLSNTFETDGRGFSIEN